MKRLHRSWAVLVAMLREIFDESAYSRYLEQHCLSSSPQAYAGFLREYELVKARRPRCC